MTINNPYVLESPVLMVEGDTYTVNMTIPSSPTITGTPTAKIYNQKTDTSTANLTGACTVTGSVITSPTLKTMKGGEDYTLAITAVVNGRTKVYLCEFQVAHPWGSQ